MIYGTGNVLGYDKVGPEYVINEVQAKTVRKIFDMYLAGNGSQKIKKQLEKRPEYRGRLPGAAGAGLEDTHDGAESPPRCFR